MEDEKQIKAPRDTPPLSTNHRRAITSVMLLLDEIVCRYEYAASGRSTTSVLYRERNSLSSAQRSALEVLSRKIKGHLEEIVRDLGLKTKDKDLAAAIRWQSASASDWLQELRSKKLRAYVPVPEITAGYLDRKIEAIIQLLEEAAAL